MDQLNKSLGQYNTDYSLDLEQSKSVFRFTEFASKRSSCANVYVFLRRLSVEKMIWPIHNGLVVFFFLSYLGQQAALSAKVCPYNLR